MSLLIGTPAYGNLVTVGYMTSCLELREVLLQANIPHNWLLTGKESLITRARNTTVKTFLDTDYQKLMFIDADIEFNPEDVGKLWNLDVDLCVGAYAMKRIDAPVSAWKDGKLVKLSTLHGMTPVDYAGTGFMMIDRNVFEKMKRPEIEFEDGIGQCWDFFGVGVEDGIYLSEDYYFCKRARELGFTIHLDPSIQLKHWGVYPYGT